MPSGLKGLRDRVATRSCWAVGGRGWGGGQGGGGDLSGRDSVGGNSKVRGDQVLAKDKESGSQDTQGRAIIIIIFIIVWAHSKASMRGSEKRSPFFLPTFYVGSEAPIQAVKPLC